MIEMWSISRIISRAFLGSRTARSFPKPTPSIPQHEIVDEEASPTYNPKHYYPAKPGEILDNQYQLLIKIGWGSHSTVWLARDTTRYLWQSERYMTVKIKNNRDGKEDRHELNIEEHIVGQTVSHRGRGIVRTCLEAFDVTGPAGRHLCLVYEPMREPLWILQKRFVDQKIPLRLAKVYILALLAGLDFLHSECKVVHTDLKLDNILMTLGNEEVLPRFVEEYSASMSTQCKVGKDTDNMVYQCQNDFGPTEVRELKKMIPQIADFGLAFRLGNSKDPADGELGEGEEIGIYPIQPDHYRAPEVILGYGWGFGADIWNLGVLTWSIPGRTDLFRCVHDGESRYDAKAHLAEIIGLLGLPPKELLTRSDAIARHDWPDPVENDAGKQCRNMRDFFGGPFFDDKGNFLHDDLVPVRSLKDAIPPLQEDEKQAFLSFISHMLTWLPKERQTAGQLMKHPFLDYKE